MGLLVEVLEERHSRQKVVAYFRRFRDSGDHVANFKAAFGESIEDFEQALDRRLAEMLR